MPTSSPVTVLITSGPVTNIWLVLSTMTTKSVSAGEYTAPPAAGPMMIEICGMTPDARVLRRKISPYLPRATTPSWMRAPPESRIPDDRDAAAQRELHDLDDLLAGDLAERSAEGREVLRVDRDRAAVDGADAGDDRVAVGAGLVHAERGGAVPHVLVELDEAAGVDEQLDALARGELALRVLLVVRRLLGVDDGLLVAGAQVGDLAGGGARGRADRSRVPPYRRGFGGRWRVRTRGRGIRCRSAVAGAGRRA